MCDYVLADCHKGFTDALEALPRVGAGHGSNSQRTRSESTSRMHCTVRTSSYRPALAAGCGQTQVCAGADYGHYSRGLFACCAGVPSPALLIILEWWGPQCGSRSAVASNTRTRESAVHTDGHSPTVPVDARRLVCGIDFDAGCAETSASTPYDGADDRCSLQRRNFEHSISDRGPRKSQ